METIQRIKIDNVDVFLEDMGNGRGKITISDSYDHNYSYFWGSMGGTLIEFIVGINDSYFSDKLLGYKTNLEMDVKGTFAAVRNYIKKEIGLEWYQHREFQKEMREKLNEFQRECESNCDKHFFVDYFFSYFINQLDFYLISGMDRKRLEKDFKSIEEHWYFIVDAPSKEYLWLTKFHKKLVTALKQPNNAPSAQESDTTEAK